MWETFIEKTANFTVGNKKYFKNEYTMFMGGKIENYKDISSFQIDL